MAKQVTRPGSTGSRTSRATTGWLAGTLAAALIAGSVAPVRAADVTLAFSGDINSMMDSYAPFFGGAERVVGSLTFDDSVADTDPAADTGRYPGALVSLTAAIPNLGFSWSADAGDLSTFPDTPSGDQFGAESSVSTPTGSPINGSAVLTLGVLFFGPDLVVGDALPGADARFDYGNLFLSFQDDLGAVVGQVTVAFVPEPDGPGSFLAALVGLGLVSLREIAKRRPSGALV